MTDYTILDKAPWDGLTVTSVTIKSGVTSIGDGAFSACLALTTVMLPKSVKSIGGIDGFFG